MLEKRKEFKQIEYIKTVSVGLTQLNELKVKNCICNAICWVYQIHRCGFTQLNNWKVKNVYTMQCFEYIKSIGVGLTQINHWKTEIFKRNTMNWVHQIHRCGFNPTK